MLTVFSTPKPFRGHIGIIQRNALQSWKRLHPRVEVILFGDEEGAAEACAELGLRHVPHVERNEHGTKYLRSIFDAAQNTSEHKLVCYVNCDIILTPSFMEALTLAAHTLPNFLMVGRRWDTEIRESLDFEDPDWAKRVEHLARLQNRQQGPQWIDYFAFPRGLYTDIPPLVIGRVTWDNWLIWRARASSVPVVDASPVVTAIHQNHDYAYHPEGTAGVWGDEQARRNWELAGGFRHLYTMEDATHRLIAGGIVPNPAHRYTPWKRELQMLRQNLLSLVLRGTRPIRHALGLRKENLSRLRARIRGIRASS